MKKMKTLLLTIIFFSGLMAWSQEETNKNPAKEGEVKIKTSAQCEICKNRIEKDMAFEKGVKAVDLDLETKILTVTYNEKKTDREKLQNAVTKIGYDADDKEADPKAYAKLPECCKKGGHDH
jgi:periplasmic mercuric ion binding protein